MECTTGLMAEEKTMSTNMPRCLSLSLVLAGMMATAACGSDPPGLYITMWSNPFSTLQVGQEAKLSIQLSQVPAEKRYVDVENSYKDIASVNPEIVPFKDTAKNEVTIKGLKPGNATLLFKLRDSSNDARKLDFAVVDQSSTDFGVGPAPDKSAPAPDKSAPAPDKGTPAPDTASSDK
jgi:hypothetical protein